MRLSLALIVALNLSRQARSSAYGAESIKKKQLTIIYLAARIVKGCIAQFDELANRATRVVVRQ